MTFFQVEELTSYWAEHPPVHLLVAAYLGIGKDKQTRMPPNTAEREQRASSDAGLMLAQLGRGFSAGDVHAGLSPVVLNFAELRRAAAATD